MAFPKDPIYKSSSFWTHMGVVFSSAAAGVTAIFDTAFLNAHPMIAAIIAGSSIICIALSQVAYVVSRAVRPVPSVAGSASVSVQAVSTPVSSMEAPVNQ